MKTERERLMREELGHFVASYIGGFCLTTGHRETHKVQKLLPNSLEILDWENQWKLAVLLMTGLHVLSVELLDEQRKAKFLVRSKGVAPDFYLSGTVTATGEVGIVIPEIFIKPVVQDNEKAG